MKSSTADPVIDVSPSTAPDSRTKRRVFVLAAALLLVFAVGVPFRNEWIVPAFSNFFHWSAEVGTTLFTLHTNKSVEQAISLWSNLATAASAAIAAAAVVIAFRSYLVSASSHRSTHMHSLFRDYLRLRFDSLTSLNSDRTDDTIKAAVRDQVTSMCLYTLEEMYAWTNREEKAIGLVPARFGLRSEKRQDYINSWRYTILVHALGNRDAIVENLELYAPCYGLPFIQFLANGLGDPSIVSIAAQEQIRRRHSDVSIRALPRLLAESRSSQVQNVRPGTDADSSPV
ncbi:hypothetical protein [Azospirillum sp. ST 5-10]|uniref:hypothetical protein n=1 Tax=unclassified Azospirillum TaxID=2630922 RepID=UPI003F4A0D34